jgi:hypothetical protein
MDPLKVAAQFAAYTWYKDAKGGPTASEVQATRFARENSAAFMPCAQEGLGRLLIKLASKSNKKSTSGFRLHKRGRETAAPI